MFVTCINIIIYLNNKKEKKSYNQINYSGYYKVKLSNGTEKLPDIQEGMLFQFSITKTENSKLFYIHCDCQSSEIVFNLIYFKDPFKILR
jgi:hypothetical protein